MEIVKQNGQWRSGLELLPFPAIRIDAEYNITWANPAAVDSYGVNLGKCHKVSHGYDKPCHVAGELCPKLQADKTGQTFSVHHVHATADGLENVKVMAIPDGEGGIIELHIPLNDVIALDGVTGLKRRCQIEQEIRRCLADRDRIGDSYLLLFLDVDHFKKINDSCGHQEGDRALKSIASKIASCAPESALVGRWGGEEFVVLLPNVSGEEGDHFVSDALEQIKSINHNLLNIDNPITISAGGFYVGRRERGQNINANLSFSIAVSAADRALYQAKAMGRDRYEIYSL